MSQRTQSCGKLNIWIIKNILFWRLWHHYMWSGSSLWTAIECFTRWLKLIICDSNLVDLWSCFRQSPSYFRSQRSSCGWTPPSPFLPPSKRSSPGDKDKDKEKERELTRAFCNLTFGTSGWFRIDSFSDCVWFVCKFRAKAMGVFLFEI